MQVQHRPQHLSLIHISDCKQTQTTEEWHNADIFRAGKMCGLRMVIGLWCKPVSYTPLDVYKRQA